MKSILVLICLLQAAILFGQKKDEIYLEKVYDFINTTLVNDSVRFNLADRTTFGFSGQDTTSILSDSLFNDSDREYFRQQFALLGKEKWQQGKIKGATVIPRKELKKIFKHKNGWERFRNKYGNCLTSFSLPIFNATHDYCIVYHWTQCDYLAGGGSTDLFKFDNGKWVFVHSYTIGMS